MYAQKKLSTVLATIPTISMHQSFYRSVDNASFYEYGPPQPFYGLGPGITGARFTPKNGPPSLYVSEQPLTTLCEASGIAASLLQAGVMIRRPLITYAIKVKLKRVLDLTDRSVVEALGTTFDELDGSWKEQIKNKKPVPTHILARSAYKANRFEGIKFKSHEQPGVANLLIWTDKIKSPSYIEVIDDTKTLCARLPF